MKRNGYIVLLVVILSSCLRKNELPDQPQITSYDFKIGTNSATMILNFTDGDGNFGLEEDDTSGVFANCVRFYNLYAEYYELQDGVWTHIFIDPCNNASVPFYNRVQWVKPTGQNNAQQGEIKVELNTWYLESAYDTIRFEVKLVDRQINESNTVVLGPFIKQ